MNIFIPAAGFGTRLAPITDQLPKPLLPVLGKPLLELLLKTSSQAKPQYIGINLHYQQEMLSQWLKASSFYPKLKLFPEDPILGSGGALKNAQEILQQNDFIVYNSDVLCDLGLQWLLEQHSAAKNLVTLTVCQQPRFNHVLVNVAIDTQGIFQGVDHRLVANANIAKRVAYTSVAVYSPEFLQFLPSGKSSVLDAWMAAAQQGCRIGTVDISHCYWNDIGTPTAYFAAVMDCLESSGERLFIHPNATVERKVQMAGRVVVEAGCVIEQGVRISNCLLLPGANLKQNTQYENCIIGAGYVLQL